MVAKGIGKPLLFSSVPLIVIIVLYLSLGMSVSLYFISIFIVPILFTIYFFRDPKRKSNKGIISPADGKVHSLDKSRNDIEIFMNVWDVHVNRAPWRGKIKAVKYFKGRHLPAFCDVKEKNERRILLLDTDHGEIKIWQISGVVGRRIVPYVGKGDTVEKGEKIGMIRYGSKVKLEFSHDIDFFVEEGQRVKAGETTLGVWNVKKTPGQEGD